MSNRSARSGKFVNQSSSSSNPAETVRESRQETRNVMRLSGKKRPSAAEKLILGMLWELESHPKFAGKSAQQILDEVNSKIKTTAIKGVLIK